MQLNLVKDLTAQIVDSNDQLKCTRVVNSVLHFDHAANLSPALQVMEELTGAQLIAEALKAQVNVFILNPAKLHNLHNL